MLTTIKPVTQTAEVAVNNESKKEIPPFELMGNINSIVPKSMTEKKPKSIDLKGLLFIV